MSLHCYSDAGFAGVGTKSQTGVYLLMGGSPVLWRSARQTTSALSTGEAELCAAALALQCAMGLRCLLEEALGHRPSLTIHLDNQSAITITNAGGTWRSRYYAVRGALLKELVEMGDIEVKYVSTDNMFADALAKLTDGAILAKLRDQMATPTSFDDKAET